MVQRLVPVLAALLALPIVSAATPASAADCLNGECSTKQHRMTRTHRAENVQYFERPPYIKMTPPAHLPPPIHYHVAHTPPAYATVTRQVELAPARAHYVTTPAVYANVTREVTVGSSGDRWEHAHHRHGHGRPCRVHGPHVTQKITQRVLVEAPRRVLHVAPAQLHTVARTVIVPAARHVHVPHPPGYGNYGFIPREHHRADWQWIGRSR